MSPQYLLSSTRRRIISSSNALSPRAPKSRRTLPFTVYVHILYPGSIIALRTYTSAVSPRGSLCARVCFYAVSSLSLSFSSATLSACCNRHIHHRLHLPSSTIPFIASTIIATKAMSRVTAPIAKITRATRGISSSTHPARSSALLDSARLSAYLPRRLTDLKVECSNRKLPTSGTKAEVCNVYIIELGPISNDIAACRPSRSQ